MALERTESLGNSAVNQSTQALRELGEKKIKQKAELVAKQLEIYIRAHPDMTVEELQNSSYFQSIAVQPVGKTGYTAVHECDTLINRFHKSPEIVDTDLHNLKKKLPAFFRIIKENKKEEPEGGYYDWDDPLYNKTRKKYMYVAIVNATTANDVRFAVAATTYIDEFTAPVKETEEMVENVTSRAKQRITTRESDLIQAFEEKAQGMRRTMIFLIAVVALIVVGTGFAFAYTLTRPLKKLTDVAKKVAMEHKIGERVKVKSNDEIGELADAFKKAVATIRYYKEREKEGEE